MLLVESHLRTILRSLTWRVVAIVVATALSYLITRNLAEAIKIGIFYNLIQLFLHYMHDRLWTRVRWGLHVATRDERDGAKVTTLSDAVPFTEAPAHREAYRQPAYEDAPLKARVPRRNDGGEVPE